MYIESSIYRDEFISNIIMFLNLSAFKILSLLDNEEPEYNYIILVYH